HVVERHPEQMFDLLRRRPMPPAGWQIGGARHAWERDHAVVVDAYAELALSLERRVCHGSSIWLALALGQAPSRAPVRGNLPPRGGDLKFRAPRRGPGASPVPRVRKGLSCRNHVAKNFRERL